jgi:hypothetical protein
MTSEHRDIRWRLLLAVFDVLLYGTASILIGRQALRWVGWLP